GALPLPERAVACLLEFGCGECLVGRLEFLQCDHVGALALQPVQKVAQPRANAVDVERRQFQVPARCHSRSVAGGRSRRRDPGGGYRAAGTGQGRVTRRPAASAAIVPHCASNSDGAPETPTPPTATPSFVNSGTPPSTVAIIGAVGTFHVPVSSVDRREIAAERPFHCATAAVAGAAWPRARRSGAPGGSNAATPTGRPASR